MVLDTFANVLRTRPELLRECIEGGATLPDERQVRPVRSISRRDRRGIHVPKSVALDRPIVIRWAAGEPGKGLVSRTLIDLGENAAVSVLEEQVPTDTHAQSAESRRRALWWGTSGGPPRPRRQPQLRRPAGLRARTRSPSSIGRPSLQQDAQLNWALASVGAQLHKSRIDNRLVGRGAGVKQVEIGFGGGDSSST